MNGQLAMAGGLNEDGFLGDRMTVNWLYEPYLEVRPRRTVFAFSTALWPASSSSPSSSSESETVGRWLALPGRSNVSYNRVNYHMIANDGNIMEHAIPLARQP